MQIMPDYNYAQSAATSLVLGSSMSLEDSFSRELDKLLRRDADEDPSAYLADAPYSGGSEYFSPYVAQETRLTQSETLELAEALRKDGASAQAVQALEDLSGTPGGVSMEQLVQSLRESQGDSAAELSRQEEALLSNLSQDLAGEDSSLEKALKSGNAVSALAQMMDIFRNSSESFSISLDEMQALVKALKLPANTSQAMLAAFGDNNELSMSGAQWQKFFGQAKLDAEKIASDVSRTLESLGANAPKLFRAAAKREELERQNAIGEERSVLNKKTLFSEEASRNALGLEKDQKLSQLEQSLENEAAKTQSRQKNEQNADLNSKAEAKAESKAFKLETLAEESGNEHSLFGDNFDQAKNSRSQNSKPGDSSLKAPLQAGINLSAGLDLSQNKASINPGTEGASSNLAAKTLEQIEQALLTAGKDGSRRLEIALNPLELGSMTVVLNSDRNGDLRALIQPDKAETAQLITQQLDQIKAELENQGLKVEKLEVQLPMSGDPRQNWQGTDQHNSQRELAEMNRNFERLRQLSRNEAQEGSSLAQDMQISTQTARLAETGLHLVA